MRKMLILMVAGLMTASALPAAAQNRPPPGPQPYMQKGPDRGPDRGPPGPAGDAYGRWDNGWGSRPPAPPRHWTRQNDWYRHARACQVRYRSYDPRTDTFVVRRGVTRRCSL